MDKPFILKLAVMVVMDLQKVSALFLPVVIMNIPVENILIQQLHGHRQQIP